MQKSEELKALCVQIYEAMTQNNVDFILNHFSQQEGVLAIGTDPEEWWSDWSTINHVFKLQLEAMVGMTVVDYAPQAYSEGNVGWIADRATFSLPNGFAIPLRLTAVFHREQGEWRAVQWHASVGVANEEAVGIDLPTA